MFALIPSLPWSCLALGFLFAVIMDQFARRRRVDRDTGDYWSRVVLWCLFPLAVLLFFSWLSRSLGSGYGLYIDQSAGAEVIDHWVPRLFGAGFAQSIGLGGLGVIVDYWVVLILPFVYWACVLSILLSANPGDRQAARWIAGGVGFVNSRYWLVSLVLLPAILIGYGANVLNDVDYRYPAAVWATLSVSVLTLFGLAFSAGQQLAIEIPLVESEGLLAVGVQPWPELMRAAGFDLDTLAEWPKDQIPVRIFGEPAAHNLATRLEAMGSRNVAPELIEAIAALIRRVPRGSDGHGAIRVLFGPENCGQMEAFSLMACLLHQQNQTISVIITPHDAPELAARLQSWMTKAAPQSLAVIDYGELPMNAMIWVVDAEILSDHLLPKLKDSARNLARIGLVAWWQLHEYSGVMAANLWAITRRLHRLLRIYGREDLRTLVLLHSASDSAQSSDFVRRLLPHAQIEHCFTHVPARRFLPIALHRLHVSDPTQATPQFQFFRATLASIEGNWPTELTPPEYASADEVTQFRAQSAHDRSVCDLLAADVQRAGAQLVDVRPDNVLALPEQLSQGGRAARGMTQHHVGVLRLGAMNPYVNYLLDSLSKSGRFTASRRLICAKSAAAIVKRHLLLGLNEMPETRDGLLQNALWDQQTVDETLRDLSRQGMLDKREVRYLDDRNRLCLDFEYRSRQTPSMEYTPLDTVGLKLIGVREPAGGSRTSGIRLRVDPERLLIMAYPGRVFMQRGQRYRINDWSSVDEVQRHGELECRRDDQCRMTWRRHTSTVYKIKPLLGQTEIGIGRRGRLMRLAVELEYDEEFKGCIEWTADPCKHWMEKVQPSFFRTIANHPFKTKAVLLRLLSEPVNPNALPSLCQALRQVLPVHLGVEEDALAVVGLYGENRIRNDDIFGMAMVDLYPGGIGVVEAVCDDNGFWLNVLQSTRDWMEDCDEAAFKLHPLAAAAMADHLPEPQAALDLLNQIL